MLFLNISLSFKIPRKLIHMISCLDCTVFVKFINETKIRNIQVMNNFREYCL